MLQKFIEKCNRLLADSRNCTGGRHNMPPPPASWQYLRIYSPDHGTCSGMLAIKHISNKLTFDLLTLKVVSKSRVTWATSMPILVFLGLSVLELGPMYSTNVRQIDVRRQTRCMGFCAHSTCLSTMPPWELSEMLEKEQRPPNNSPNLNGIEISCMGSDARSYFEISIRSIGYFSV